MYSWPETGLDWWSARFGSPGVWGTDDITHGECAEREENGEETGEPSVFSALYLFANYESNTLACQKNEWPLHFSAFPARFFSKFMCMNAACVLLQVSVLTALKCFIFLNLTHTVTFPRTSYIFCTSEF